ncbi:MAG: S24/S26 family peptidase [Thermoleophilia bacterium]
MKPDAGRPLGAETLAQLTTDVLGRGASVRLSTRGGSMTPSIRDGDVLRVDTVRAADLRVGDVILYRDAWGRLLAHRVLGYAGRRGERSVLVVRGDAFRGAGERILSAWVLGRVVGVERDGRYLPLSEPSTRWCGLAWARAPRGAVRVVRALARARRAAYKAVEE